MSQSLNDQKKEFDAKWVAHCKAEQDKLVAENTRLYGPDTAKWPHKTSRVVDRTGRR